jgi:hypothetical protein
MGPPEVESSPHYADRQKQYWSYRSGLREYRKRPYPRYLYTEHFRGPTPRGGRSSPELLVGILRSRSQLELLMLTAQHVYPLLPVAEQPVPSMMCSGIRKLVRSFGFPSAFF